MIIEFFVVPNLQRLHEIHLLLFNMNKEITSIQNPYIKELFQLKEKSRDRKKSGLFLIEGEREINLALKGHYDIDTILFFPELFPNEKLLFLINSLPDQPKVITISKDVYEKLAHRSTTEGVLAVAKSKSHELQNIEFKSKNPLILIAEAPEKPGNIGAILRTADAAECRCCHYCESKNRFIQS